MHRLFFHTTVYIALQSFNWDKTYTRVPTTLAYNASHCYDCIAFITTMDYKMQDSNALPKKLAKALKRAVHRAVRVFKPVPAS